jgi:hypothetical protein
VAPAKVHVIPHGAFEHLTRQPHELSLPDELARVDAPVVLFCARTRGSTCCSRRGAESRARSCGSSGGR